MTSLCVVTRLALLALLSLHGCESSITRKGWKLLGPAEHFWHSSRSVHARGSAPLIRNGADAEPNFLPSMASLQVLEDGMVYHICGGTLADKDKVLTAAHCLDDIEEFPHQVALGIHVISQGCAAENAQIIPVEFYDIHESYNGVLDEGLVHDIAMLYLFYNATLNPGYVEIQRYLSAKPWKLADSKAFMVGWGRLGAHRDGADVLQYGEYKVLSKKRCHRYWDKGLVTPQRQVCALGVKVADCGGDSGGPLLNMDKEQVGIVSWGTKGCNLKYPSVLTSVGYYYDWIQERL